MRTLGTLISSTQLFAAQQTRLFLLLALNSLLGFYKYICPICLSITVSLRNTIFFCLIPLLVVIIVVTLTERHDIHGRGVFIARGMKARNTIKLRQPVM